MAAAEQRHPEPFTRELRFLHAARNGDIATVERALALGVDVDSRDDLQRSALLLAVRDARSLELTRLLRVRGAKADDADRGGRTPLSFAASLGRMDLVEFLVSEGARIDSLDALQRTPLFYAAIFDRPAVISYLHARGAKLDVRGRYLETPLIAACAKNAGAAAKRLLELGADASLVDRKGRSARDRAVLGTPACLE